MSKLKEMREKRGLSREALAELVGTTATTIYRKETGMRGLKTSEINRYAEALGCEPIQLIDTGTEYEKKISPVIVEDAEGAVQIPVYDVTASAGNGIVIHDENVKYHATFRLEWLKRVSSAPLNKLAVISVEGDSMQPTLSPEDTVLVDMTQTQPRRDGIYVLRYDDAVLVKRLRYDPQRRMVTIISDNIAYPPLDITDLECLHVIGRVLWLGRRV